QFVKQAARFDFSFAAKIDELAIDAIATSTPAVLIQKPTTIDTKCCIAPKQFVQLDDHRLDQCGNGERVVHARLRVADAHLQRVEKRIESNIPPNFLGVINTARFQEQFAVILVFGKGFERVHNSRSREWLESIQAR